VLQECEKANFSNTLDYGCTLLNICTILSKMNKHENALSYATKATEILSDYFNTVNQAQSQNNITPSSGITPSKKHPEITMLCIAHHNMGVELEFLGKQKQAVEEYQKGLEIATKNFDPAHNLIICLTDALFEATEKLKRKTIRHEERSEQRVKKSVSFIQAEKGLQRGLNPVLLSCVKATKNTKSLNKSYMSALGHKTNSNFMRSPSINKQSKNTTMLSLQSPLESKKNFINPRSEQVYQHIKKMVFLFENH